MLNSQICFCSSWKWWWWWKDDDNVLRLKHSIKLSWIVVNIRGVCVCVHNSFMFVHERWFISFGDDNSFKQIVLAKHTHTHTYLHHSKYRSCISSQFESSVIIKSSSSSSSSTPNFPRGNLPICKFAQFCHGSIWHEQMNRETNPFHSNKVKVILQKKKRWN